MSRRRLGRKAAQSAAALLLGSSLSDAEESPAPIPALDRAVADAAAQAPHLPASDAEELRSQVRSVLELVATLRAHPVPDTAEPDFVYDPSRRLTPGGHRAR